MINNALHLKLGLFKCEQDRLLENLNYQIINKNVVTKNLYQFIEIMKK